MPEDLRTALAASPAAAATARMQPEWVATMRDSGLKADFELAVRNCDNGFAFKILKRWIDALALGDVRSLSAELNE